MEAASWQIWWWILAALAAGFAWAAWCGLPADSAQAAAGEAGGFDRRAWLALLRQTLSSPGPWLVALTFFCYSSQWLAVIGFLPSVYAQSGLNMRSAGALTAAVSLVNMLGNVASGLLLRRGLSAGSLLGAGFAVMGLGAFVAFGWTGVGPGWRYLAVLAFSAVGGLIPGTLFNLAVQVAPSPQAVPPTVGWLMQWSSLGQFAGPPLVAWVAQTQGGWHHTWWVTGGACVLGALLAFGLARYAASAKGRAPASLASPT